MRPNALNLTSTAATGSSSIFCNRRSSSASLKGAFTDSERSGTDNRPEGKITETCYFNQTYLISIQLLFSSSNLSSSGNMHRLCVCAGINLPISTADAMARATRASFCMMTCSLVAIEMRCWTPPAFATAPTTSWWAENEKRRMGEMRTNSGCVTWQFRGTVHNNQRRRLQIPAT